MAVLIEGISVVIRVEAIHARYPGGWPAFRDAVPNGTLCSDNELARVGFMSPDDAKAFVGALEDRGLVHLANGTAQDMVVADQLRGLTTPCDWSEHGTIDLGGDSRKLIAACRLVGSTERLFTPDGWDHARSLSSHFTFVAKDSVNECMEFLRHEDGLDIYLDRHTGQQVCVGRSRTNPALHTMPPNRRC